MLRLPTFEVIAPRTVAEVVAALKTPGARLIAGGTDLLPNLKHRLGAPALLVSLSRVDELRHVTRVTRDADELCIGASVTLTAVSEHALVRDLCPSLSRAAGLVASPPIRNMATIGGNIHLDTRCRYVNQTEFWRSAIGGCLKSEGSVCHVVPGGKNCVAAMSSDCVPVLITLDAEVVLVSARGERRVAMAEYYNTDGVAHINKAPDELMTQVCVPAPAGPRRAIYVKWTVRRSIDFPLVSVAMRFDLDSESGAGVIKAAKICVGVLNAAPRLIKRTAGLAGKRLDDPATHAAVAELVHSQSKPLGNVPYDAGYRRAVLPVHIRRALASE
jgi:4-hydroxybenzoyl-CoA reductase subunit beta